MKTYYNTSLTIYAGNMFFFHMLDNGRQTQTIPTTPQKTQRHKQIPKAPKRKQKKQDTSIDLNNIMLSFQKATPINYARNNLFTP